MVRIKPNPEKEIEETGQLTDTEALQKNFSQIVQPDSGMTTWGKLKLVVSQTRKLIWHDRIMMVALLVTAVARTIYFTLPIFYLAWMLSYMKSFEQPEVQKKFCYQASLLYSKI
jgi:hypothetical protein